MTNSDLQSRVNVILRFFCFEDQGWIVSTWLENVGIYHVIKAATYTACCYTIMRGGELWSRRERDTVFEIACHSSPPSSTTCQERWSMAPSREARVREIGSDNLFARPMLTGNTESSFASRMCWNCKERNALNFKVSTKMCRSRAQNYLNLMQDSKYIFPFETYVKFPFVQNCSS